MTNKPTNSQGLFLSVVNGVRKKNPLFEKTTRNMMQDKKSSHNKQKLVCKIATVARMRFKKHFP